VRRDDGVVGALRTIALHASDSTAATVIFHTRGDGSATYACEQKLWTTAQVSIAEATWLWTYPVPPYQALEKAEAEAAYLLTDRATYLTAKQYGVIPQMRVYVEVGEELLNPCSALVNTKVPQSHASRAASEFADWLASDEAQKLVREYGRDWKLRKALFTVAGQADFGVDETLIGLGR